MDRKGKKLAKGLAVCLTMAMVLGSMPEFAGVVRESKAADLQDGNSSETSTVTGGAAGVDLSQYAPTSPSSVKAKSGSKRVRLTWSGVSNADGYYIYMRPSTSASYTKTATITDGKKLFYVKKSLLQNTKYYFQISAYHKVGDKEVEGTLSSAVSATTASVSSTSKAAKKYSTKTSFTKSPAYKKYTKMKSKMNYSKSFAIPGMKNTNVAGFACKTMIPQAICYAGNYLLISAYDSKGVENSVIYVVSKAAKSYIMTLVLPNKAKVGGMAYDGKNIWISKGGSVACFPYSFVTEAVAGGTAYKSLSAYTSECKVKTTASYVGYYDGVLWIGPNTTGTTRMYGYGVNDKDTVPFLTEQYSMAMPSRTQGITFGSDGTMFVSRSYRTKPSQSGYVSQIRTYRPSYGSASSTGKIKKNAMIVKNAMPPKVEGMAIYGSYMYTVFSSCQYSSCKYPVDRVIALKTTKLV